MSRPEDIQERVWDDAIAALQGTGWSRTPSIIHAVARAIMSAEQRGAEREREACAQAVLDYPPEGFNAALYERTERRDDHDPFWKFEGDTGNWAALMGEVLKPYADAIRNRSNPQ